MDLIEPPPDRIIERIGDLRDHCNRGYSGGRMNSTQKLHDLGQSLWLDNITREILDNGTLRRYIGGSRSRA